MNIVLRNVTVRVMESDILMLTVELAANASASEALARNQSTPATSVSRQRAMSGDEKVDLIHMILCSVFVVAGCLGNFVSMIVFVRSGRRAPKIVTKHLLILLTAGNMVYLLAFWFYSVLPKLISYMRWSHNGMVAGTNVYEFGRQPAFMPDSNLFVCKGVAYLINTMLCLNALITVLFSVERAFAVNFPLQTRSLRENHRCLFSGLVGGIVAVSFLFPTYTLVLAGVVPQQMTKSNRTYVKFKCDVASESEMLYFKLSIAFIIKTLAVPFVLITVSNTSIVLAMFKSKRSMQERRFSSSVDVAADAAATAALAAAETVLFIERSRCKTLTTLVGRSVAVRGAASSAECAASGGERRRSRCEIRAPSLPSAYAVQSGHDGPAASKYGPLAATRRCSSLASSGGGGFALSGNGSGRKRAHRSVLNCASRIESNNLKVTKMLITISASFVLLNFPYFMAWCLYAHVRLQHLMTPKSAQTMLELSGFHKYVKLTEILKVIYYSFICFMYFAASKTYKENLLSLFIRKPRKSISTTSQKSFK